MSESHFGGGTFSNKFLAAPVPQLWQNKLLKQAYNISCPWSRAVLESLVATPKFET
jgi:hypothetical protein